MLLFVGLLVAGLVAIFLGSRARGSVGIVLDEDRYHGSVHEFIDPLPASEDAKVAVLRDSISYEPEHAGETNKLLNGMKDAGFTLMNFDGAQGEDMTDAEARLRARIGLEPHGTPAARQSIVWWLSKNPEYAGIVWIGRDMQHGGQAYWFIDQPGTSTIVTETASRLLMGAEVAKR